MRALLLLVALAAPATAQQRGMNLTVPERGATLLPVPPRPPLTVPPASPFEPAPLPNRDLEAPSGPPASNAPTLSPSLFNRSDQYRGDGYSRGSTAQTEQERRVRPGAGFNLRMPFAPN
jgi:hypothetical protein